MIICIDIGNTNVKYAIYDKETLKISFRVATDFKKTSDEYGSQLVNMLKVMEIKKGAITGGIISSVVPSLDYTIDKMCALYLGIEPLHIEPGLKSGLNIRCDDAREVGADQYRQLRFRHRKIRRKQADDRRVDFGTATTFNIISGRQRIYRRRHLPGHQGLARFARQRHGEAAARGDRGAEKHHRRKTPSPICRRGLVFGFAGLVEYIVTRIKRN